MKYINSGRTTRTFYDVEFKPGEIKDVPGYINDSKFFTVPEDTEQAQPKEQVEVKTVKSKKSKDGEN